MSKLLILSMLVWLILPQPDAIAASLASSLAGRILLDVEQQGEAWYVDPISLRRSYLGRPHDALAIMSSFGLGIANTDLNKIPEISQSIQGDWSLRRRLAGRILLQVQEHGQAWYVDPVSLKRVYLGNPTQACYDCSN